METLVSQEKNQKLVKVLSWILIIITTLLIVRNIFGLFFYSYIIKQLSHYPDSPSHAATINYAIFLIENAIELVICSVLFVSSIFVLKFSNTWRKVIVYGLITAIIYLIVFPLINYYNSQSLLSIPNKTFGKEIFSVSLTSLLIRSYAISILLFGFFAFLIAKLSKNEIKLLFK